MTSDAVTLRQALNVAQTGAVGSLEIAEPWVHEGGVNDGWLCSMRAKKTICAPGPVDLEYLRSLKGVRPWRKEDAR